ncbi:MAG TPA: ABC transporter ATP-binding protein [Nitrososphaerales archaeon]|nr:ABC transporter ATP-binding protein [Nitrososphaerales archaeon]
MSSRESREALITEGPREKAIVVENLLKTYPPDIRAVDTIGFSVDSGEVFGLLGPNGAGKTTTIKMITGLIKPTSGSLRLFGVDVAKSPQAARRLMGYVPQNVSVDGDLSGYENLLIFSRLFFVERDERRERIAKALEYVGLSGRADELVKHYSGGMMRRLEVAQALVNRPKILFLDEPAIGLDPGSRREIWESIRQLRKDFGTTIFITTHDMSEADYLCDRVAIMDSGKIVVMGSPSELKESLGGDIVTFQLTRPGRELMLPVELGQVVHQDDSTVKVLTHDGRRTAPLMVLALKDQGIEMESMSIDIPSLDDVFLKYTKKRLDEHGNITEARAVRRSIARYSR